MGRSSSELPGHRDVLRRRVILTPKPHIQGWPHVCAPEVGVKVPGWGWGRGLLKGGGDPPYSHKETFPVPGLLGPTRMPRRLMSPGLAPASVRPMVYVLDGTGENEQ